MKVCVLASGSKGNSTYIEINNKKILIDVGLTITSLEKRLKEINVLLKEIDYIFISHAHSDHTQGLEQITKKYKTMICLSEKMKTELPYLDKYENLFISDNSILLDDIKIDFIKTSHDSADSRGFVIEHNNKSLVLITDTGYINSKHFSKLKNKTVYIFESNHDPEMLIKGKYPKWLQARILSDVGHLSNIAASTYLSKLIGPKTKKIFLAHLSEENNTEEKALEVFFAVMKDSNIDFNNISVAKQDEISEVIEI